MSPKKKVGVTGPDSKVTTLKSYHSRVGSQILSPKVGSKLPLGDSTVTSNSLISSTPTYPSRNMPALSLLISPKTTMLPSRSSQIEKK